MECNHILLFKDGAGEAGKPEGRTHKVCPKSLGPEVLHEEETFQSGKMTYKIVSVYALPKLTE